jgi:DNA-binding CsgD family transcriptional regulator
MPETSHLARRFGRVALLIVHTHDLTLGVAADILHRSFGLTTAELRLAEAMLEGGALSSIARKLGVTHSTARTQLRNVFAKTSTHRQAELLKLIVRLQSTPGSSVISRTQVKTAI